MTVEERTKKTFDAFMNVHYMDLSDEMVWNAIAQALRDQIEECARLVDQAHLMSFSELAKCIRALAAPGESNQGEI